MNLKPYSSQASQAWMEWLIKKRKAFDQRGDMAIAAWAEQQQRELNLRARRLSRSKVRYPADLSCFKPSLPLSDGLIEYSKIILAVYLVGGKLTVFSN